MTRIILIALPLVLLAACNSEPAGKSTTKLDAVEVQPGTISDSMIILDDAAGDGTAVDNSVPDDGTKKEAPKAAASETADTAETDESSDPDAVEAPVAQKAISAESATKKTQ
ncbi:MULTISPECIES: hypothetical protein [unclassified Sphingopyxis]|uniref:hypothetical protein n=1 Tax=unclassified Sphingopyxis TaxID=2614943 RepID=UPI000731145A|nr:MULTISPECIES: hypothetical protein [unclassified Sphingopyxis]KTE24530.1 hypothetical protein ATE61_14115 [Sphingopyxis sp. H057]KTE49510.1 hypothetical protein ATE69_20295 [Sphingopyxis sp. H071]KTE52202.1 hypothetical protein ATE64_12420 [Sphingopyxis sp. H073]KTE60466.1 hypothetical protein ATE66_07725 [Sphingopyxis sp. H107]KTE63946.1 hypothetical protein ATE65_14210 [Sphingopyxis sp. H100]